MQPTLKHSMELNLKIMPVLEITVKGVKVAITHILKYIRENMIKINEKIGNLSEK